jgi:glycosyltransferase involved in cell wall biosynthesis
VTSRVATIITRLEGGAGVLAVRGVLSLDPARFQPVLITGSGGPLLDQAAAAGVEVIVAPALGRAIHPWRDLRALGALRDLLRGRSFDVVHTHTAKAGVLGRLAGRRAGTPRIVHTYHGFPFHEFQSRARRSAYIAIERRLGRITDVTLCVGAGVAVEAVRRGLVAPDRVRTIGVAVPAVNGGPDPGARDRARRRLGVPLDATVVGCVGRLTYQKAPEDFLAAIRALGRPGADGARGAGRGRAPGRRVTGVWIGGGELAGRIGRLAAKGAGPPVVLAGERADVLELLPAFDVFLLPSRYEGLPTVVVEAIVCGIPVVATAVNAVSDVVVPGETGLLVPPGRPDLMADSVRYLLDQPAVASRMAERARDRLGHRFDVSSLRHVLEEAYCVT